ncbi:MAG TPA: DUF1015 family protein [Candidatus Polarisedimenticolaceae bacterium]|nr:DUF1015 family protein [Candidatus Polarisedimenticolaceae bacterium]
MIVKPFRGLRPRADLAARIASYPYDVLSSAEARRLAAGDPYTFLHVIKPEIDLDPSVDAYDDRVYVQGRQSFAAMRERGWLVRDERPAYYVYRLTLDGRSQTGILGAAAVDDYLHGRIRRHELTRPDKENDRVRLNEALGAHPGPVFLAYHPQPRLDGLAAEVAGSPPSVSFTAPDGITHELWVVDDPERCARIEGLLAALPESYIADGHHRAAAAARVAERRRATLRNPSGLEPAHFFLAAHFPADQLRILDYNRLVRDLCGMDRARFLEQVDRAGFEIRGAHHERRPPGRRRFGMYLAGAWYLLTARPEPAAENHDPVAALDISLLSRRLLEPVLDIRDPRTDPRIDFVGGIRGMDELERRVDSGEWSAAFALHPTSLDEVMRVADAGKVMPPKSTWFEPKLRSGLVVQLLEGDTL